MHLRRLLLAMSTAALALPAGTGAEPIVNITGTTLDKYQGAPYTPTPMTPTKAPRHPYMAPNPRNNIHNDPWMTDAYAWAGPVGKNPVAPSSSMPPALCGSLTFDSNDRIVSVCPSLGLGPTVRVIDPKTLEILSTFPMPNAPDPVGQKQYQNFAGGGYFYLDGQDRIWSATKTSHLFVLQVAPDGSSITQVDDYDLTSVLDDDERITSALPDFQGRIWFVSKRNGKIGILDTKTREVKAIRLGEDIQNSFTIDKNAIYIASSKRMYRFRAGADGLPKVDWKVTYKNSGIVKPGQADAGSGTTPTLMTGGYVSITDNADPMNVVVYRKAKKLKKGKKRTVCEVPVFEKGASANENSLMTANRSLFVENNYGYQDPFGPNSGAVTTPGLARVDVNKKGTGCRLVWNNTTERVPTSVSKLSTATGLIYTYTRDEAPAGEQPYFWTAISAKTGKTAFKVYAGSGLGFNNNYAGIAIGPDGDAYIGVTSGLVALRDQP